MNSVLYCFIEEIKNKKTKTLVNKTEIKNTHCFITVYLFLFLFSIKIVILFFLLLSPSTLKTTTVSKYVNVWIAIAVK